MPAPTRVVEIGSTDVNGTVRHLLGDAAYTGVDIRPGRNVDVVADGATYQPRYKPDLVLCLETLEHAPDPEAVVINAYTMLKAGGHLILTAACDPRKPHGVNGGGVGNEHYQNISEADLTRWLEAAGAGTFTIECDQRRGDIRAFVTKPKTTKRKVVRP